MEDNTRKVRSYKKTPTITVPDIPTHIIPFLPHPAPTSVTSGPSLLFSSPLADSSPLDTTFSLEEEKLETKFRQMEDILVDSGFDSIGDFLQILFYNHTRAAGKKDPQGCTHIKMSNIITLIYSHKHSVPSPQSTHYHEQYASFSPAVSPAEIFHARPSLFTWATNLVGKHVHQEIYDLAVKDNEVHLRASANGRQHTEKVNLVTWKALGKFSIAGLCDKYKEHAPVMWYLTESMAASHKNGAVILKKKRPHPVIQVGAISSFILSHNAYANGDLAMALGIWHFSTKSHVDVKQIYSSSLACLRDLWCLVLDNVQEYCPVYEGGIAHQNILKVGTAGTAICLKDCKPGAFDLESHLAHVGQKKRKSMTTESLRTDIDWTHVHAIQALHWVHILVNYIPELNNLSKEISHCMHEGCKTITEIQGMAHAIRDFDEQMGIDAEAPDKLLFWQYLCSIPDNHDSFCNCIATPEIWHTKAMMLNSIVANHYGPATSKDPSSLSRCSGAVNFKCPANLSSCNFYPTLPCRMYFDARSDLLSYFTDLVKQNELPTVETLIKKAETLVSHYATQDVYEQALSLAESTNAPAPMKITLESGSYVCTASSVDTDQGGSGPQHAGEEVPNFSWWTELAYAVPEGDIGRVFEIMKIWIFSFAGSSHSNYTNYLLEASNDLHDAILNNWLVNMTGELGKWIEADLLQEHYNCWLEDMGKTHTSPHLQDDLHSFCVGRSLGHAAINQFNEGYKKLDGGKLDDFLLKSTFYADVITEVWICKSTGVEESIKDGTLPGNSNNAATSDSHSSTTESVCSSASQSSQSQEGEMNNEEDPGNDDLVSGSYYDTYLAGNQLVHKDWNERDEDSEEESSDEEDIQEDQNGFTSGEDNN
ncbi:hypothetical protein CPB84DRAFT_1816928 [Gymnopilus junonius]|uniref:DUF6589 domain-containing protein n=1 Tax=Gymnopilus junonius TaxID=109634 RepID=A0A9P5NDZ5_GYMJU|nr:hypothetical protein CPB84DRAFT_1816928 [Gymnopilus junonius]